MAKSRQNFLFLYSFSSVDVSCDSEFVAAAVEDENNHSKGIYLFDLKSSSSKPFKILDGYKFILFHPFRHSFLTLSSDQKIIMYDIDSSQKDKLEFTFNSMTDMVLCYSPGGDFILISSLKIGDSNPCVECVSLNSPNSSSSHIVAEFVTCGCFFETELLFCGNKVGHIYVFSYPLFELLQVIPAHTNSINTLSIFSGVNPLNPTFTPSYFSLSSSSFLTSTSTSSLKTTPPTLVRFTNPLLVSSGDDGVVTVWDVASLTPCTVISRLDTPVLSMSLSCDGKYVAYCVRDRKTLEVALSETGEPILSVPFPSNIYAVKWSPTMLYLSFTGKCDEKEKENNVKIIQFVSQ